jgi:hypothetical protein
MANERKERRAGRSLDFSRATGGGRELIPEKIRKDEDFFRDRELNTKSYRERALQGKAVKCYNGKAVEQ